MSFSAARRMADIKATAHEHFDLAVIGGGITGAGIALDAASRGLKTILIEKGDYASGTSSKSTKLIHGGLRYLKQFEFKLVHESGTERAVVNSLAPHLVRPEKMLLPLVRDGSFGKWSTSIGLRIYDFLAKVRKQDRRRMLGRKETLNKEPLLDKTRVVGGGYYAEYRTDDARLTIEIIKKAVEYKAVALNYSKVESFIYKGGKIAGLGCRDVVSDIRFDVKSTNVVSAAGPWVDEIRKINNSIRTKRLHLTKGVHLVVPHKKLPIRQSIYFDTEDGRMVFAIPRGRIVYVGTTDTTYTGSKERIVVTTTDRDYLLRAVNQMFPAAGLSGKDVVSNWAGLRPLIHQKGKSPSELSRKDEIFESEDGLISIAGGKLTGYRKMAEKVVDRVLGADPKKTGFKESHTERISLCGRCLESNEEVDRYIDAIAGQVNKLGLDAYHGWYLVTNYGTQCEQIIDGMARFSDQDPVVALALSECAYGCEMEMIVRAGDFFIRRTGRLFFDIESIPVIRQPVMDLMAKKLGWTKGRRLKEESLLDEHMHDAKNYYIQEDFSSVDSSAGRA